MTSLLQCAYVEQRCNACGGRYHLTLAELLMERRVERDWQPARPCSLCAGDGGQQLPAIPVELLEELESSWQRVAAAAAQTGVDLQVSA